MSIDANGVVTNGMLARYDAGIKDIIAMRTAEKNPVRYKVVKSTSTGSQTYSFYKKDENDTDFVVDSTSDAITVQDSIDSTSKDPVNGAAVAAEFATQMTTQNINSIIGYTPMDSSLKGAANGVASLDGLGQVPTSQLPLVDTYSATGTKPVTGTAVAAALATLPEPMVFKGTVGTGGTVTSLPTAANSNKGHTYKAISDNIVSGSKIGDTFISTGSAWVTIPSGDEPSGTVTQVGINASSGSHLSASGTVTSSGNLTVGVESGYQIPTSSDVSQISTNKSNILYVADQIGKNQLDISLDTLKAVNTSGTWNGNVYTHTAGTATVNSDGSITIKKTSTASRLLFYLSEHSAATAISGTKFAGYIYSGCPPTGSDQTYGLNCEQAASPWGSIGIDYGNGYKLRTSSIPVYFYIALNQTYTTPSDGLTFKPMICTPEAWSISHEFEPFSLPNYDLTRLEAEDRAALAEEIDAGAKNKFNPANIVELRNLATNGSDYAYVSTVTDTRTQCNFCVFSWNGNTKIDQLTKVDVTANGKIALIFTKTANYNKISFGHSGQSKDLMIFYNVSDLVNDQTYVLSTNVTQFNPSVTNFAFSDVMLCTKAAFGVSQKFVPYDTRQWQFIERSFTSTAADTYEYSGVSFTVPANQIYEFVATDTKENARTTGILIADNNTNITNPTEKTTIAENKQTYTTPDDKVWIRQVSGITGKYNSALTYYVWVKRYSAHASTVSLAYHRIV